MCGLIFSYTKGADDKAFLNRAERSLAQIEHRGPDDKGIWQDQSVVVGHRRLSIIDLAASRQPMCDPSERYILAYNGEVYNFRELRDNLKDRWNFKTDGDTEVVLAGLILYDEKFLNQMEGMWAFALWDNQEKKLLISRDRMGKKPLFYESDNHSFSCASELNALSCLFKSSWQEDLDSTADYLRYGYYLPGTTAYKDVYEILPGHILKWQPDAEPFQAPYWSLSLGNFSGTKKQASTLLREKFIRAVERRMLADVEVGAFLSGGVDSSLVVAVLCQILGLRPKTFTIGFTETSYDERKYANTVSKLYKTDHFEQIFENWDRDELITLILKYAGQPFSDSSLLPTSMVSRLASEHVKVVLSGDGGDELFSGYQRYQARALLRWYSRLPKGLRHNTEKLVKSIPEPMSHHSRSLIKKAHLFIDIVNRQEDETPYTAPVLYDSENFKKLLPDLAHRGHVPPSLPAETREDSITEMMTADALIYLPQDIMTKVDRASMAHSLEARAPFLDKDLVELAFSLPRKWHRRGLRGKRMLQESFQDLLPDNIWHRRKQGFGVPIHHWFRKDLGEKILRLTESLDTPVNKGFVKELLQIHQNGQRDHGYRLWNIYVYLLWKEQTWQIS